MTKMAVIPYMVKTLIFFFRTTKLIALNLVCGIREASTITLYEWCRWVDLDLLLA